MTPAIVAGPVGAPANPAGALARLPATPLHPPALLSIVAGPVGAPANSAGALARLPATPLHPPAELSIMAESTDQK
jgi:hypothetical protein